MRNDDNSESKKCPQIRESRGPVNGFKRNLPGTVLYKKGRGFHPSISKINFCASCVILLVRIILLIHNLVWNYIKTMPLFASMLNSPLIFKFVVLLFFCGIFIYLFKCLSKPPKDNEVYRLD